MVFWHINYTQGDGLYSVASNMMSNLDSLGHESWSITTKSPFFSSGLRGHLALWRIKTQSLLKRTARKLFTKNDYYFYNFLDFGSILDINLCLKNYPKPDVIILYWVSGFLNNQDIKNLKLKTGAKIYWYLMDMAPLTGGCHYNWNCDGYKMNCQSCPALRFDFLKWLPKKQLQNKSSMAEESITGFISPSNTISRDIIDSFAGKNIPVFPLYIGIDENLFQPMDKEKCKNYFNLKTEKFIIFAGARSFKDKRKGFAYLLEALEQLAHKNPDIANNILLLLAGNGNTAEINLPIIEIQSLGYLHLQRLATAFNVCSVFISPSIQDAGPMMVNQALMCGTPIITFDVGVAKDFIKNNQGLGFLAQNMTPDDLYRAILEAYHSKDIKSGNFTPKIRQLAVSKFGKTAVLKSITDFIN